MGGDEGLEAEFFLSSHEVVVGTEEEFADGALAGGGEGEEVGVDGAVGVEVGGVGVLDEGGGDEGVAVGLGALELESPAAAVLDEDGREEVVVVGFEEG